MECEICGNEAERLVKRLIENVEMYVCEDCQDLGIPVKKSPQKQSKRVITKRAPDELGSKPVEKNIERKKFDKEKHAFRQETIKSNVCDLLQQLRQRLGMTIQQFAEAIQEKQNYYARIEKGKVAMPISLAKRIEEKFNVKLTEVVESSEDIETAKIYRDYFAEENEAPMKTLGDMIKFKKKDKK